MNARPMTLALILSAAGFATATGPTEAARLVPYAGVGQHAAVMNNFARDRQRNDAVISHVQNNIRSTRPKTY